MCDRVHAQQTIINDLLEWEGERSGSMARAQSLIARIGISKLVFVSISTWLNEFESIPYLFVSPLDCFQ